MNTNEKIAIWLKLKCSKMPHPDGAIGLYLNEEGKKWQLIDFIHDRNQQKWIEDKLKEDGWRISYLITVNGNWAIVIFKTWKIREIYKCNESKDLAFIQAVEQLIDKG
jgi:hypothetical protein